MVPINIAPDTSDQRVTPEPRASRVATIARAANHNGGGVASPDINANAAIPVIDPPISTAYARSGGMEVKRRPNGRAAAAITMEVNATISAITNQPGSLRGFFVMSKAI